RRPSACPYLPWMEEASEDDRQHRDDAEEKDREHRTGLPIGEPGSEEVDDLVAVHVAVRSPDERWRDELAECRDEDEEERGHDPGQGQRQRHPPERLQAAGAEVARSLEEAPVEALERDEDRQ